MTRGNEIPNASQKKGGFRRLTFDEAFPIACEAEDIREELSRPLPKNERSTRQARLRSLDNRLTPAARQSSAPFERLVRDEAMAWIKRHGGMSNISAFIRYFQSLPTAKRLRWKSGKLTRSGDDAIRKILRKSGIRGRPGRPRTKG